MKKGKVVNLQWVVFSVLLTFWLGGCVYDPHYYGPPAHSHFYPHEHDYYYYPGVQVYFHFSTGYYYYYHRKRWVRTRALPPRIHIDSHDRVRIRIGLDRPYIKHPEHRRRYPASREYRRDKSHSLKEREANRKWYKEYKEKGKKHKKRKKKERKDY